MIKRRLLEKLLDELNGITQEDNHFNIHELSGFFYALAITPPSILPEHWEGCMFRGNEPNIELKHIENLMPAAFDVYDSYTRLRSAGQLQFPFDIDKLRGKQFGWANQWCNGFWAGLSLCKDFWFGAASDNENTDLYWEEVGKSARLFEVLITREYSKLTNIEQLKAEIIMNGETPTDEKLFDRLFKSIPSAIEKLQHVVDDIEAEFEEQKTIGQPAYRPKIDRNDPCPCGSGKKSRQCCLS